MKTSNNQLQKRRWKQAELEDTIKHELIHYELKDNGKDYHGHGQPFLKRARQLNIVGVGELTRCFSIEEIEHTPRITEFKKIP